MTKDEARREIRRINTELDAQLDAATSQFQIRIAYVGAYNDIKDYAQKIVKELSHE